MASDEEPSLRDQLIAAREKIVVQIDEMRCRSRADWLTDQRAPPDYRSLVVTLEGQLREIDELLDDGIRRRNEGPGTLETSGSGPIDRAFEV